MALPKLLYLHVLLQVSLVLASSQCKSPMKGNVLLQMGKVTRATVETTEIHDNWPPYRTWTYETKYSWESGYICPIGRDLTVEVSPYGGGCSGSQGWARKKQYYRNPSYDTCATCQRNSAPLPRTLAPDTYRYWPSSCPESYVLAERVVCASPTSAQSDLVQLATCSSLGANYTTASSSPEGCAALMGGSFVLVNGTKYVCQTCVLSIDSTTSTMTTTPTTTTSTTSLPVTGSTGSVREWEEFAGPFNRVCRGAGPTDNNPAYFEVRQEIPDVEACKELCLQELGQEGCKGVEYNVLSKRCELWKRNEGIWAFDYPKMEGFSCLRYGWPGKYLIPVNGGLNQACRGPDGKNSASFYVVEAVRHMEDCRARCVAARLCKGVEYSKGRCEIWHSEVATTEARTGFECLRYEPPDVPEPVAEQPMH
ncbi:unnamed protein product [Cladocopium goreaui]|uniref:Apple domain-containing protein n=1 Tax=Cladocopium goreaui TaxID=2562237 RepID=A0A9P1D8B0_9DINO|nr:unnamed protein product [Cladocopium goreaui]|mmetsp:Transcript_26280/g.57494  ORF Transcript_26280/g.57494 Transcript_26280/m.57494 type:complete len:423 (+) Transcript_26280:53-1321(+)